MFFTLTQSNIIGCLNFA